MNTNYVQKAISEVIGFQEIHDDFVKKLTISGLSEHTVSNYARSIAQISVYFKKLPLELTDKELRDYLFHLKGNHFGSSIFKFAIYSLRKLFELNSKRKLKTQLPSIQTTLIYLHVAERVTKKFNSPLDILYKK
jgi:site-specific recombinase XerD